MKIIYYTNKKYEILVIKDNNGKIIKKGQYNMGNCLLDILYGNNIICDNEIVNIDGNIKQKITYFLEKCDDYLHNNIRNIVEKEMSFIFKKQFSYQNIFIENKLCRVYFFDDLHSLICLLLTHIYTNMIMYKRCMFCHGLFATRYTRARFCKRIATKSGKSCGYASKLKSKGKSNGKFNNSAS